MHINHSNFSVAIRSLLLDLHEVAELLGDLHMTEPFTTAGSKIIFTFYNDSCRYGIQILNRKLQMISQGTFTCANGQRAAYPVGKWSTHFICHQACPRNAGACGTIFPGQ